MNVHHRFRRAALLLLSPDQGGASGGGEKPKPKTLTEALAALEATRTQLAEANQAVTNANAERDQARAQFDTATEAATTAQAERDEARTALATAQQSIATITQERDQARTECATANTTVSRLEKLCGVKGISIEDATPAVEDAPGGNNDAALAEQWAQLKREGRHQAAMAFYTKNAEALDRWAGSVG